MDLPWLVNAGCAGTRSAKSSAWDIANSDEETDPGDLGELLVNCSRSRSRGGASGISALLSFPEHGECRDAGRG